MEARRYQKLFTWVDQAECGIGNNTVHTTLHTDTMSVQPSAATALAISKADTALTAEEEEVLTRHIPSMEDRKARTLRHWDPRASGYDIPDAVVEAVDIYGATADDGFTRLICYVDPSEEPTKSNFTKAYKKAIGKYKAGSAVPTFTNFWASASTGNGTT